MLRMEPNEQTAGQVILLGAGPGDPTLVTQAGCNWLSRCDVVVYDRLSPDELLELTPATAERIYVGKQPDRHPVPQEQINQLLIDRARKGKLVVRLKGGDPLIFGRGGEEAAALREAGVSFRIVPGITAAVAAASYAGIPLTDRRVASSVAFVTGQEDADRDDTRIDWAALAGVDTLVVYMGVRALGEITAALVASGKPAETPAAMVERASTSAQRVVAGTLGEIADLAAAQNVKPPALLIVGPTVTLRRQIAWREHLPLAGKCVLVTRSRSQASRLSEQLRDAGAEVIEAPTIDIEPAPQTAAIDGAIARLGEFDWLCFTSSNGVDGFFARLIETGRDVRSLGKVRIAAIGSATAGALEARGLLADLMPSPFTSAAMADALLATGRIAGKRFLLARADIATDDLPSALAAAGAEVTDLTVYRTARPESLPPAAVDALRADRVDWVTFTSSSTVDNFAALAGGLDGSIKDALGRARCASIGPVTSAALRAQGLSPAVQAEPHTIDALVAAIIAGPRPGCGGCGGHDDCASGGCCG